MNSFETGGFMPEKNETGSSEVFTSQINEKIFEWIDVAEGINFDKEVGEQIGTILEECTADLNAEQAEAETINSDSVEKYSNSIGDKLRQIIEEEIINEDDKRKAEDLLVQIKLDILDVFDKSKAA